MTISQEMHYERRIKNILSSSPIFAEYMQGSYKPDELIEQFEMLLTDSDKQEIQRSKTIRKFTCWDGSTSFEVTF